MKTLDQLKIGDRAIVKNVLNNQSIKRRFLDIGLIPGSIVECVLKSPMGDPIAYFVRGAVIAIRKEDSKKIEVDVIS